MKASDLRCKVYVVGGAVRDVILKEHPRDFDTIVVPDTQAHVAEIWNFLTNIYGVPKGEQFPVWITPIGEIALAGNADGATTELMEDLKRRDFTINAIAVRVPNAFLTNQHKSGAEGIVIMIRENWNEDRSRFRALADAYKDITSGHIRLLPGALRMDPIRAIRAARLKAKFPQLKWLGSTIGELNECVLDPNEYPNRINREVTKALESPRVSIFFKELSDMGKIYMEYSHCVNRRALELADHADCPLLRFALCTLSLDEHDVKFLQPTNEQMKVFTTINNLWRCYYRPDKPMSALIDMVRSSGLVFNVDSLFGNVVIETLKLTTPELGWLVIKILDIIENNRVVTLEDGSECPPGREYGERMADMHVEMLEKYLDMD
ncbi:tRNA nucleotidyltransferase [Vibrio phage EniLVp02]